MNQVKQESPLLESTSLGDTFQRLRPRLKYVLSSFRVPAQDAEDVLQEALLVATQKWDQVHNKECWLIGTLRFKCAVYWRRQRAQRVHSHDTPSLERLAKPQPALQEREILLLDLMTLTRELGRRTRAALWLRFGYGLTHDEVAARLGYCGSSVRKMTVRSLARLQRLAAGRIDDPPR